MADHSKPVTTDTYALYSQYIRDRIDDVLRGLDPAIITPTNLITNSIRWSSASSKWQKWNGTTWGDLSATYAISITGNAATATTASACSGNAATATILQTARTINTVSFNGSANIVVEPYVESDEATAATRYIVFVDSTTDGHQRLNEDSSLTYNPSTGTVTAVGFAGSGASLTSLPAAQLTGSVAATVGGTGQTVYAVGDILYASTTTALSKLADVATGNALISGGVGIAPAWGKVGLTTHVSGTLAVGNGGIGVATLSGLAYGNGTSAFTAASAAQVVAVIGATAVANATTATHLAGGLVGAIPYQTGAGATALLAAGTNGYYLRANGGAAPSWEAPATVFGNIKVAASETATGVVELATTVEAAAGTDTTRVVTPAGVKAAIDSISPGLTLMTAQETTSGTSKDFTGIPSTSKRVTVIFTGMSTNGSASYIVQIGSGAIDSTGYTSAASNGNGGVTTSSSTIGFLSNRSASAGATFSGTLTLVLTGSNVWVASGVGFDTTPAFNVSSGSKTISGALDRLRITTSNGTDTFDAGSVNVMYE